MTQDKIVFSLVRPDALNIHVQLTMKGAEEEVAAMIFTAMASNEIVKQLILKTVAGYCAVHNIAMADIEKFYK